MRTKVKNYTFFDEFLIIIIFYDRFIQDNHDHPRIRGLEIVFLWYDSENITNEIDSSREAEGPAP